VLWTGWLLRGDVRHPESPISASISSATVY
jgi:hypothetical protein